MFELLLVEDCLNYQIRTFDILKKKATKKTNKKQINDKKENKFKGIREIHDSNTAIAVSKHLCIATIYDKYLFYILPSRLRIFKILKYFRESLQNIMRSNTQGILNIFKNILFGINKRGGADLTNMFMTNFNEILVQYFFIQKRHL